jgi:hypothetical protein
MPLKLPDELEESLEFVQTIGKIVAIEVEKVKLQFSKTELVVDTSLVIPNFRCDDFVLVHGQFDGSVFHARMIRLWNVDLRLFLTALSLQREYIARLDR